MPEPIDPKVIAEREAVIAWLEVFTGLMPELSSLIEDIRAGRHLEERET